MGSLTTKQDKKTKVNNPTGKGGFKEHPELRSDGRWKKNNSFTYWLNYFKSLKIDDFAAYKQANPKMTMAALGAYARVAKMVDDLREFQEVANRTEGMPKQSFEHSTIEEGFKLIIRQEKDEGSTVGPDGKTSNGV